jgi:hypothetical protein
MIRRGCLGFLKCPFPAQKYLKGPATAKPGEMMMPITKSKKKRQKIPVLNN